MPFIITIWLHHFDSDETPIEKARWKLYNKVACCLEQILEAIKPLLYDHISPISQTIQVRRAKQVGHSWSGKDELVSDILQWTPTHVLAK